MKNILINGSFPRCAALIGFLSVAVNLTGCADLNYPYGGGSGGGYSDPYYNGTRYDDQYYRDREIQRAREQQRELDIERDKLDRERRELDAERSRNDARIPPPRVQPPPPEHCPSGFSPSENKCSPDERRRGCRDIRLPSGLGCVSR